MTTREAEIPGMSPEQIQEQGSGEDSFHQRQCAIRIVL